MKEKLMKFENKKNFISFPLYLLLDSNCDKKSQRAYAFILSSSI